MTENISKKIKMENLHLELGRDEMVLNEKINMEKLKIIRDHFDYLYDAGRLGVFKDIHNDFKVMVKENAKNLVFNFYKSKLETNIVKYKYPKGNTWGRMYSTKPSLQSLNCNLRHTLSSDLYLDLDFVNCHFQIAKWYATKNHIAIPCITNYIENRDACIDEIMTYKWSNSNENDSIVNKNDAKKIILSIMNGAQCSKKFERDSNNQLVKVPYWLSGIESEVKQMYELLITTKEGLRFKNRVIDLGKTYNIEGSTLNYVFCKIENQLLTRVFRFLKDKDIQVGTFVFDGLMLYSNNWDDSLIPRIEEILKDEFEIDMKIKIKPFDNTIDLTDSAGKPLTSFFEVKTTDEDLALHFLEIVKNDILYDYQQKHVYIYSPEDCLWKKYSDFDFLNIRLTTELDKYLNLIVDPKDRDIAKACIRSCGKQIAIMKILKNYLKSKDDSIFIETTLDKIPNVLPINDCLVVNLTDFTVSERTKFHYFTKFINVNFNQEPNFERAKNYIQSILGTTNEEYVLYFIKLIGYMMTGLNNLKVFPLLLGPSNTGKSLFIHLLSRILGPFSSTASARVFKQSRSESSHESSIFSLIGSRVSCVTEMSEDDIFNEDLLKIITGDDFMNIRKAGMPDSVSVNLKCVPILITNHVPKFKDSAFSKRMKIILFPNVFVQNSKVAETILGDLDNFFSVFCYGAKLYNQDSLRDVSEVIISTKEIINTHMIDPISHFLTNIKICYYEITGKEEDTFSKKNLYFSFINFFMTEHLDNKIGKIQFSRKVLELNYKVGETKTADSRLYTGILKLKDDSNLE